MQPSSLDSPWLWRALAVALSVGLVGTLWAVPYLPTNDGPESVFSAHAENHYSDPGSIYSDQLVPTWQYASKGFSLVFGPLEGLFGWQDALRVTLCLSVLATAWGTVLLVEVVDPRRRALGFLGFPLALSWVLYMGFFAFTIGAGLGLFALARVVKVRPRTGRQWAILGALLLLQSTLHVFSAVLTGLVIASVCLFRARKDERAGEFGKLLLAGLPAVGVAFGSALQPAPGQVGFMGSRFTMLPWRETLATLPRLIAPGPAPRALLLTTLIGVAAVASVARMVRPAETGEEAGAQRGLACAGVTLLALGVFAPRDIPGWQLMSPRFLPLGALLVLATAPFERLRGKGSAVASVGLFVVAVGSLAASWSFHRALVAGCSDVIAALSADVRRTRLQLPVNLNPVCGIAADPVESEVPYMSPLRHIGALLAVVEGGRRPTSSLAARRRRHSSCVSERWICPRSRVSPTRGGLPRTQRSGRTRPTGARRSTSWRRPGCPTKGWT